MKGLRNYACDVCNIICNSAEQLRLHESGKSHLKKCSKAPTDIPIPKLSGYLPPQLTPPSDSESDDNDMEFCSLCCNHFTRSEFLMHNCDGDISANDFVRSPNDTTSHSSTPLKIKMSSALERSEFHCSLCKVSLGSWQNYESHVKGKKHLDIKNRFLIKKAQDDSGLGAESLPCSFSGIKIIEGSDSPVAGSNLLHQPVMPSSKPSTEFSSLYCGFCDTYLNSSTQLLSHVEGKKHKNRVQIALGLSADSYLKKKDYIRSVLDHPTSNPIPSGGLLPNSVLCPVCKIAVSANDRVNHERGRTHIYKSAMDKCSELKVIESHNFKRKFDSVLPSIISQLPPFSERLQNILSRIAESSEDVVVQVSFDDFSYIPALALACLLSLVNENKHATEHIFSVWICRQTLMVPPRIRDSRDLVENFSATTKPLFANIQKESFHLDDHTLDLTKHTIVFSTPGSLKNLMEINSTIWRIIPAIVFTDVESSVPNDPTYSLLMKLDQMSLSNRPRIIFITTGRIQNWPSLRSFAILR